jgi:hypothetical protein
LTQLPANIRQGLRHGSGLVSNASIATRLGPPKLFSDRGSLPMGGQL